MKRLVFIVEGNTEIALVNKLISPYLYSLGYNIPITSRTIITNRKQHKKGGVSSYGKFRNEVERTLAEGNVIVTTLIDFFKLPTDFPCFTEDSYSINLIEEAISVDIGYERDFIPYIQRHEFEALMFSSKEGFEFVIDDQVKLNAIQDIIDKYPNPEDINNTRLTAPSKRMENIFDYDKTSDGEMIIEELSIKEVMNKCPRFKIWIEKIIFRLDSNI